MLVSFPRKLQYKHAAKGHLLRKLDYWPSHMRAPFLVQPESICMTSGLACTLGPPNNSVDLEPHHNFPSKYYKKACLFKTYWGSFIRYVTPLRGRGSFQPFSAGFWDFRSGHTNHLPTLVFPPFVNLQNRNKRAVSSLKSFSVPFS